MTTLLYDHNINWKKSVFILRKPLLDFTQQEFAQLIKVSESIISKWERDLAHPRPKNIRSMKALAKINGIIEDQWLVVADDVGLRMVLKPTSS